MEKKFQRAWEFLQSAAGYSDLNNLQGACASALASFGFDRFSCALARSDSRKKVEPYVLFGRSYEAWDNYYLSQGYLPKDPCVRRIFINPRPFAWTDMPLSRLSADARKIRYEAAEAGARNGFVVPVHGACGELHGVRFTSPEKNFDPKIRPTLHAIAVLYTVLGSRLLEKRSAIVRPPPFSPREIECLRWVSEGKSDWDISEILNIAECTVHEHIERAKAKLGVRSRVQTVAISAANGWLDVKSSG